MIDHYIQMVGGQQHGNVVRIPGTRWGERDIDNFDFAERVALPISKRLDVLAMPMTVNVLRYRRVYDYGNCHIFLLEKFEWQDFAFGCRRGEFVPLHAYDELRFAVRKLPYEIPAPWRWTIVRRFSAVGPVMHEDYDALLVCEGLSATVPMNVHTLD